MIIWAVGIGVLYFFKSDGLKDDQPPSFAKLSDSKISESIGKTYSFSQSPSSPTSLKNRVDQSVKEPVTPPLSSSDKQTTPIKLPLGTTSTTSTGTKKEQSPALNTRPESQLSGTTEIESPASPTPVSAKASTKSVVESIKKPGISTPDPKPTQEINHETIKANGTFYSAQKIMEGVIIGRRGSSGDVVDFYKITATGNSIILKLEPSMENEDSRFIINIYDEKQKQIGKISDKTDSSLNIPVSPQTIYYIGIDLRRAPIEIPPYKLHVKFN